MSNQENDQTIIPLESYAAVIAGLGAGLALSRALLHAEVSPRAWDRAAEHWPSQIDESAATDLALLVDFDTALLAAKRRFEPTIAPIESDLAAWAHFRRHVVTAVEPVAFLAKQGLSLATYARIEADWAKRVLVDEALAAALQRHMDAPLREPPTLTVTPSPLLLSEGAALPRREAAQSPPDVFAEVTGGALKNDADNLGPSAAAASDAAAANAELSGATSESPVTAPLPRDIVQHPELPFQSPSPPRYPVESAPPQATFSVDSTLVAPLKPVEPPRPALPFQPAPPDPAEGDAPPSTLPDASWPAEVTTLPLMPFSVDSTLVAPLKPVEPPRPALPFQPPPEQPASGPPSPVEPQAPSPPKPLSPTAAPPGKRLIRFDSQTGEPLANPYWVDVPPAPERKR